MELRIATLILAAKEDTQGEKAHGCQVIFEGILISGCLPIICKQSASIGRPFRSPKSLPDLAFEATASLAHLFEPPAQSYSHDLGLGSLEPIRSS